MALAAGKVGLHHISAHFAGCADHATMTGKLILDIEFINQLA